MSNQVLSSVAVFALSCSIGCQKPASLSEGRPLGGGNVYQTRDEVRALCPNANWLETEHDEVSFIFCANDLPAYGNSRMEVRGWVFRPRTREWKNVLTVQLNGVVSVELSVDPKTGLFMAKGNANSNKFKDHTVCTLDLRALLQPKIAECV